MVKIMMIIIITIFQLFNLLSIVSHVYSQKVRMRSSLGHYNQLEDARDSEMADADVSYGMLNPSHLLKTIILPHF